MNFDLDYLRLLVFVGGLGLFFTVETFIAARPWRRSRWRRLGFHGGLSVLNAVIIRTVAYVPFLLWSVQVEEEGWGISRWLGLTGWTEIIVSLIVLDAFDYFWHRANHRVSFLWRFHKPHHSDTELDVTTALRFHPGELLISAVVKAGWIVIWGPTVVAWLLFECMISLCAQFHHMNIDLGNRSEKMLKFILVTPRFHAAHHAVDRNFGDRNFSTIFPFWDMLFGSYARPADDGKTTKDPEAIGLPDGRDHDLSAWQILRDPFNLSNLSLSEAEKNSA